MLTIIAGMQSITLRNVQPFRHDAMQYAATRLTGFGAVRAIDGTRTPTSPRSRQAGQQGLRAMPSRGILGEAMREVTSSAGRMTDVAS